jgi:hypothetical protein
MFYRTLLAFWLSAFSLQSFTMEKEESVNYAPYLRASIRIDHPVHDTNVSHYSLFRGNSVSTFINITNPTESAKASYFITRTVSHYHSEGVKESFYGTIERPEFKNSRIRTNNNTYEVNNPFQRTLVEGMSASQACALYKALIHEYKLTHSPVETVATQIRQMQMPSKPITGPDSRATVIEANTQCNILS